jgi:hypothetical protein
VGHDINMVLKAPRIGGGWSWLKMVFNDVPVLFTVKVNTTYVYIQLPFKTLFVIHNFRNTTLQRT